ncbi:putative baseplate assembly protein [Micromonospora rhizosphaerae]|uniref:Putative baseplate assembly protein n=1 Tax=Micromonospora rhizosphaerae TaxID=568872 RepID=A0A1C6SZH3_9ACTN|nr:baseplate J/gp47 family protein [Micromonospora rhizosphaerae]SCL34976.1 putative baseplate assembly protein [Micromonospora rhizosphaerae]
MAELNRIDGRPVIDYMARDYESLLAAMRQRIPEKLPEWRGHASEADFGNVLLELFAHLGDILSFYQDRVANESFLGTARTRRSVIEHLRLIGYELGTAAPASADLTLSVPADVTETVTIRRGDAFATASERDRPSVRFEYTRDNDLRIDFGTVAVDEGTGRKVFRSVPVEQGRLFTGQFLGTSDGSPDQRFPLPHPGLILRPPGAALPGGITVTTTLPDDTAQKWTLRDTLAFSGPAAPDFAVRVDDQDRATVVFGDGRFGAVPPPDARVSATYRVGGGTAGNVPPGAIGVILDAPRLARLGATVTNPAGAAGGADRESIEHAVRHAPAVFRSMRRAVTAADYEAIALSFKGVAKVRAVATSWNEVTLFVAPEGGGRGEHVSDVLEANLRAFFEDKRMLSQIVEIADVDYVPIRVTAEVAVESYHVTEDVLARVRQAGADLLAFDRVGFNETVFLSRFYERCQDVPGVQFLNITEFRRGDTGTDPVETDGVIVLGPSEIPIVPTDREYQDGMRVVPVPGVR